ncbi:FAD-binding oxidoreductase [Streptomyces sp. NPDC004111]|uniref:FAD-binding oxidoreductase n=1 Tax=Streptomyces sp. NPDC004111 TaxID=3364690 RepID=UPI0036BF9F48
MDIHTTTADLVGELSGRVLPASGTTKAPGAGNSGGFRSRRVPAAVEPRTPRQVADLLREYTRSGAGRIHVHPTSSGRNWGFGSAEPVADGAVVMRLHHLDRIRELDTDSGVCVVEPGVTQGTLAARLAGTGYLLNVTASAAATSVVGNVLDRGIGLRRQRSEDLVGLEVALADGTLARVGRWPRPGTATTPYDHPPGPNPVQLFAQSNLGVVTAAVLRLIPATETLRIVTLRLSAERFDEGLAALRGWHANRIAAGVVKIFDAGATAAYGGPRAGGYRVFVPVAGRTALVTAACALLREEAPAAGFTDCRVLDPAEDVPSVQERAALRGYAGDPRANDPMVEAVFGTSADEADAQSRQGWLFCVPVVPFTAPALRTMRGLIADAAARMPEATVGHTLNVMPSGWVDVVVSLRFARTPATTARAHALLDALHRDATAAGFPPYRLDVDRMAAAAGHRGDAGQEALLRRLKTALDPQDIIARGRYA